MLMTVGHALMQRTERVTAPSIQRHSEQSNRGFEFCNLIGYSSSLRLDLMIPAELVTSSHL